MPENRKPELKDELAFLGRGILRTLLRDVAIIGGAILVCAVVGYIIGASFFPGFGRTYALIGVMVGIVIGYAIRSHTPLFDYDRAKDDNADR